MKYFQMRSGPDKCHFNEPSYLHWLDQLEMFVEQAEQKDVPFFSFNFLTEYTHAYLAVPEKLDLRLKRVLERLNQRSYLDNTLLMVLGDHGNRLKYYSYSTEVGKLEKYIPFLSIKVPQRLENTALYRNMFNNKNRLVSFHDLYQTMRHFLYMNKQGSDMKLILNESNREQFRSNNRHVRHLRGISLFESIPLNRTCANALIPDDMCSCFRKETLTDQEKLRQETNGHDFKSIAMLTVNRVNRLIDKVNHLCKPFELSRVVSIKKIYIKKNTLFYTSVVVLRPGDAWFETNLKMRNEKLVLDGEPVRISAYGTQSKCVKDNFLVNYCYCKDQ